MQLNLSQRWHAHHWVRREPDWTAAAVAGFLAGAVLMTMELVWSALATDAGLWRGSHQVAAIVMGRNALQSDDFNLVVVATALVTHYVLGVVFGLVLGAIMASTRLDSSWHAAAAIGALFGALLYAVNFYVMSEVFIWFAQMRSPAALAAHVVFGVVAALAYRQLERPAKPA